MARAKGSRRQRRPVRSPKKQGRPRPGGFLVDVCGLTVTSRTRSEERQLHQTLHDLQIQFGAPPIGHPFQDASVQLFSVLDLNLLLLSVYGTTVDDPDRLCRRQMLPSHSSAPQIAVHHHCECNRSKRTEKACATQCDKPVAYLRETREMLHRTGRSMIR